MESIVRSVKDIEADQRRWIEETIGHRLQDNQQLIIRVFTPDLPPDPAVQAQTIADLRRLSEQGSAHRERLGISEVTADAALDEAMQQIRPRSG